MPENLRVLKGRIRTARNIAQLAKTLEMVSVSKIRRARGLADTVRPYAERITGLTEDALRGRAPEEPGHPYLAGTGKRILLAIGPDKGLCGPLAGNLARKLADTIDEDTLLITVGKRMGVPGARLAGRNLIASFPMGARLPRYSLVYELVRVINERILSGEAGSLDILYARFVSFFSQAPTVERLLPLAPVAHAGDPAAPFFEPGRAQVLERLLPHFLEVRLFDAVVQAFSAEHAARMVAMQNAKSNAVEIADTFTLLYNKTRQERITGEILDLANKGKRT
jgi:F-type H+-transporting ATPase subunit gamma